MRRLWFLMIAILCLIGGGWFGLGTFERKAIYPFDPTRVDPAALGLTRVTEQVFRTAGHDQIVWVAMAKPGRPTIFYLHGNAGNLANRARRFEAFTARGYGLIAPAYRGSSGSTGRPSEAAITQDLRRLFKDIGKVDAGFSAGKLVIYGESLGTGVALKMLNAPDIPQPAGVVLEAPFTSLPDVVRHVYPQLEPLIPQMKNIWDSKTHAAAMTAPLLVLHGARDGLIPTDQGRAVFQAAQSAQKRFIEVPDAGHNDIWRDATKTSLWQFIDGL